MLQARGESPTPMRVRVAVAVEPMRLLEGCEHVGMSRQSVEQIGRPALADPDQVKEGQALHDLCSVQPAGALTVAHEGERALC